MTSATGTGATGTGAAGPVGEEAARLVEALGDWARGLAGGELPLATGSEQCTLCPLCQLIALARRANPETFSHLADATTSLIAAMRTVVDSHAHVHGGPNGGRNNGVQRIDLDGDGS